MDAQTREFKMPDAQKSARKRTRPAVCSIIGAIVGVVVAVALCVYAAMGQVEGVPIWGMAIAVIALLFMSFLTLFKDRRGEKAMRVWKRVRPFIMIIAAPLGFYLLERTANKSLFDMDPFYAIINICILSVLYAIIFFIGQRTCAAAGIYLVACLVLGMVNHFVIAFKGQPLTPADLAAWQTAAAVSPGYAYTFTEPLVESLAICVCYCMLMGLLPHVKLTRVKVIVNTAIAVVLALCFGLWVSQVNIKETYSVKVDVWFAARSYGKQGTALCFLAQFQELQPEKPDGYSSQEADELLKKADETKIGDTNRLSKSDEDPTVIVIMNETFSDLSKYPGLEDTEAYPDLYYKIADTAVESGDLYVSAMGGGTCNSEFELLTGASIGNMGGGVYPYMLYDLTGTTGLPSYFDSKGYATHAIHPAEATNWRRDRIYQQLEFNDFTDIAAFEDAPTLRDLVTDRATYDYILDLLEADEDPQFIFDVTIQNHSGYTKGGISDDIAVSVDVDGSDKNDEMNEYLSCLQQSDEDIDYLVKQLEKIDRPIVLCFFGDHQPSFNDWLFEATHDGKEPDELGLYAVQERYEVPYMIWANKAAQDEGITEKSVDETHEADAHDAGNKSRVDVNKDGITFTSTNYLSARLVEDAGLELSPYYKFLLNTEEEMPAINLNGFMTDDGTWYWYGEDDSLDKVINNYKIVQYDNLFNKKADW